MAKVGCIETGPCVQDTLANGARHFRMAIWFVSPAMESTPLRSEAALGPDLNTLPLGQSGSQHGPIYRSMVHSLTAAIATLFYSMCHVRHAKILLSA